MCSVTLCSGTCCSVTLCHAVTLCSVLSCCVLVFVEGEGAGHPGILGDTRDNLGSGGRGMQGGGVAGGSVLRNLTTRTCRVGNNHAGGRWQELRRNNPIIIPVPAAVSSNTSISFWRPHVMGIGWIQVVGGTPAVHALTRKVFASHKTWSLRSSE